MEAKSLLIGICSFMAGGLLVSVAAVTFEKPNDSNTHDSAMTQDLASRSSDDFDKRFIEGMIAHHQDAIDMANLAGQRAKHEEIKELSKQIVDSQGQEIVQMKQWQSNWGYDSAHNATTH